LNNITCCTNCKYTA